MVPTVVTTTQNAQVANANGSTVNLNGYDALGVQVTGTFGGTIFFECSIDGQNWVPVVLQGAGNASLYANTGVAGVYTMDANHKPEALGQFRTRTANMVSGNVTVTVLQSGPAELQ